MTQPLTERDVTFVLPNGKTLEMVMLLDFESSSAGRFTRLGSVSSKNGR